MVVCCGNINKHTLANNNNHKRTQQGKPDLQTDVRIMSESDRTHVSLDADTDPAVFGDSSLVGTPTPSDARDEPSGGGGGDPLPYAPSDAFGGMSSPAVTPSVYSGAGAQWAAMGAGSAGAGAGADAGAGAGARESAGTLGDFAASGSGPRRTRRTAMRRPAGTGPSRVERTRTLLRDLRSAGAGTTAAAAFGGVGSAAARSAVSGSGPQRPRRTAMRRPAGAGPSRVERTRTLLRDLRSTDARADAESAFGAGAGAGAGSSAGLSLSSDPFAYSEFQDVARPSRSARQRLINLDTSVQALAPLAVAGNPHAIQLVRVLMQPYARLAAEAEAEAAASDQSDEDMGMGR